jgi:TPR repeat protein
LQRLPYDQQSALTIDLNQHGLQGAVGNRASLLSRNKTIEMYRDNVKKTADPEIQYAFATFLVDTAQILLRHPATSLDNGDEDPTKTAQKFLVEARQILQHLADRSYPFAQYYLADGLANGILNKGKEDDDRALPLFVAASKRGHAESAYRAALCYEYGWGGSKAPLKAAEYFRHAASKNHPGAMFRLSKACLAGDLGMEVRYREGIKWLKRAAETADDQYNAAPYELGVLHESGYGDDIFKDETYAVQLFTKSADLGHVEANFRLGDAYEHGKLGCPCDSSLSVHFYNGAASRGHASAMLALCAWYMVGAPPALDKDENEAYEWARRAGDAGTLLHKQQRRSC